MYKNIMIPVDLAHADKLEKALATSADLAKHYGASLHLVGVTAATPGSVAHTPAEFGEKLENFAAEQTGIFDIRFQAKAVISHDPAVDLDDTLAKTASEIGADLVVMASHVPGFAEHILSSHAGYLASHSSLSVFIVR